MLTEVPKAPTPKFCSFCGKAEHEVFALVAGPGAHICDECIELVQDVIAEKRRPTPPTKGTTP